VYHYLQIPSATNYNNKHHSETLSVPSSMIFLVSVSKPAIGLAHILKHKCYCRSTKMWREW